jgi:hypothetical protein
MASGPISSWPSDVTDAFRNGRGLLIDADAVHPRTANEIATTPMNPIQSLRKLIKGAPRDATGDARVYFIGAPITSGANAEEFAGFQTVFT